MIGSWVKLDRGPTIKILRYARMDSRECQQSGWWALVFACAILAACAPIPENPSVFMLKMAEPDVQAASASLAGQLVTSLSQTGLPSGYPKLGQVIVAEEDAQTGVRVLECLPSGSSVSDQTCLLIDDDGDYLQVSAVTWQSEAYHMFRVYVVADEWFVSYDPTKDYVAVDVFVEQGEAAWQRARLGIERAVEAMGGRPIAP
jgi:hypothetical protein